jgi:Cation efflux family
MPACISRHDDPAAVGEADIRSRALAAGWRHDAVGRLVCPYCQQRNPGLWAAYPLARQHPPPAGASRQHPAHARAGQIGGVRATLPAWYRQVRDGLARRGGRDLLLGRLGVLNQGCLAVAACWPVVRAWRPAPAAGHGRGTSRALAGGRGRWQASAAAVTDDRVRRALARRGFALEYATLAWNVAAIVVLAIAAIAARSVALAGFALDSLIDIGASTVVIWELSGAGEQRQRRGLRLIGYAFAALAVYLLVQSTVVLASGYHPHHSVPGIIWTAVTAAVMFALAAGKARTGRALENPVLRTEGRVTLIDAILATAVLLGLVLNAALGWWWADPAAGYVLVFYAARQCRELFAADH